MQLKKAFLFVVAPLLLLLVISFTEAIYLAGLENTTQLAQVSGCPNTFCSYGFGANATGGQGYPVVYVTTLADSPGGIPPVGSLREALTGGNRIIKFKVSGTIELKNFLSISYPNITIDGSDAPNGGIALSKYALGINADNVVVRYIRLRGGNTQQSVDDLSIQGGSNILIDHVTCTWGTDECMEIVGYTYTGKGSVRNVTIQNSLIAEETPPHDYGMLVDGDVSEITWYRNVFAKNGNRNPQMTTGYAHSGAPVANPYSTPPAGTPLSGTGYYELVQNIVYDAVYDTRVANWGSTNYNFKLDVIGNYFKLGPKFPDPKIAIGPFTLPDAPESTGPIKVFLTDNTGGPVRPDYTGAGCDYFSLPQLFKPCGGWSPTYSATTRQVTTHSFPSARAQDIANQILDDVGASLPCRDSADTRIVSEIKAGTNTAFAPVLPDLSSPCPGATPPPSTVNTLLFSLSLEGANSSQNTFTVAIHNLGSATPVTTKITTLNGSLQMISGLSVTSGSYDLYINSPRYLGKKITTTLSDGVTITVPVLSAGDLNTDGIINSLDWSAMSSQWGTANTQSDINRDGVVNSIDFYYLNKNWGKTAS